MNNRVFSNARVCRRVLPILILTCVSAIANSAVDSQAIVSLGSGSSVPGGTTSVNITMMPKGGAQPAALEWTMNYPASDIASIDVVAGASAIAAGKKVSCSAISGRTICVLFGPNKNVLGPGIAATATIHIASGVAHSTAAIQVAGVVAADPNGVVIPSSGSNGAITITHPASAMVPAPPSTQPHQ